MFNYLLYFIYNILVHNDITNCMIKKYNFWALLKSLYEYNYSKILFTILTMFYHCGFIGFILKLG